MPFDKVTDNLSKYKPIGWYGRCGHRFYNPDWTDVMTGVIGWHCDECKQANENDKKTLPEA